MLVSSPTFIDAKLPEGLACSKRGVNVVRVPSDIGRGQDLTQKLDVSDAIKTMAQHENRMAGRYAAQEVFDYLVQRLRTFQEQLEEDRELGVQLANFGKAAELHVRSIGYSNPNLIEFVGVDGNGDDVSLVQHVSQLNFLLTAVKPIADEPYRVGFVDRKEV